MIPRFRFILNDDTIIDLPFWTVEAAQAHADYIKARGFYQL